MSSQVADTKQKTKLKVESDSMLFWYPKIKDLSIVVHWEINCVVPRRNELAKLGLVVQVGKRRCGVTGNNAISWKVKE